MEIHSQDDLNNLFGNVFHPDVEPALEYWDTSLGFGNEDFGAGRGMQQYGGDVGPTTTQTIASAEKKNFSAPPFTQPGTLTTISTDDAPIESHEYPLMDPRWSDLSGQAFLHDLWDGSLSTDLQFSESMPSDPTALAPAPLNLPVEDKENSESGMKKRR
ncbi:hypothetical protein K469DRAFT_681690 [Zopfia rhizophila CBS 207.26]|uniref:Uncharacterized protein n=1 Tax=Zopfia rhizophila CBS 207.26 TaxID=1314779 RepID=A0A6A6EX55_9PEZI|nr:hypothetical protein K469DRAFT_681690 [Zopfia rhizophila CBS 207.26]